MRGHVIIAVGVVAVWLADPASAQVVSGGKGQPRNTPGTSLVNEIIFGGMYTTTLSWQIDDAGPSVSFPNAPGVAGGTSLMAGQPDYGWDLVHAISNPIYHGTGNFLWYATPSSPLTVALQTLTGQSTVGNDVLGPMDNFNPNLGYAWPFVVYDGVFHDYVGSPDDASLTAATIFDVASGPFANAHPGAFGWHLIDNSASGGRGGELDLTYTPVPEPGTLALTTLAGLGLGWMVRHRRR